MTYNIFDKLKPVLPIIALMMLAGCSSIPQQAETTEVMPAPIEVSKPDESAVAPEPGTAITEAMLFLDPGVEDEFTVDEQLTILTTDTPIETVEHLAAPAPANDNLWTRIRNGFRLPDREHPGITADLNWYRNNPDYLKRSFDRARPYFFHIVEEVEARGMPLEIALLPVVESAFQPFAYSRGRAAGIWQFIPETGKLYGLKQNWWYDGRRDVYAATRASLTYLQNLNKLFAGDWLLALAAYNCGEGTLSRAIKKNQALGKPTDFWSLDLPAETRGYVPKLLALSNIVTDPARFQMTLDDIPNKHYFALVETGSQIELSVVAELAGMRTEDVYLLNPGFNRWATDPDGPHYLLIPLENAARFSESLADLPESKRVRWAQHKVLRGERLASIAKKYNTSASLISSVNKIKKSGVSAGDTLLIPVSGKNHGTQAIAADAGKAQPQGQARNGQKSVHVVQAGESLWEIANKYKVGIDHLLQWNALAPGDVLKPGQQLAIWTQAIKVAATLSAPPMKEFTKRIRYTVKRGDSLARIAQQFNVSVNDLIRWNSLKGKKHLQPGQTLTLFVDVTKQSGNL